MIADRGTDGLLGHVTWYWESQETNWLSVGIGLYNPESWGKGLGYGVLREEWRERYPNGFARALGREE